MSKRKAKHRHTNKHGYGTCPICNRMLKATSKGAAPLHRGINETKMCAGSGQLLNDWSKLRSIMKAEV